MWGSDEEKKAFSEIYPLWHGEPDVRSRLKAVKKLRPLAEKGYAPAQFALAWALFDGDSVRRDYLRAFEFFIAAAEQGYPSAEVMAGNFYLMAYPRHNACEYDEEEAARWHRRAAEHGNTGAMTNLADSYSKGRGAALDHPEVYLWASLAVELSKIRNRTAEVLRDHAAALLDAEQRHRLNRRIAELRVLLPQPWSEHSGYWKLLYEQAG